MRRGHAAVAGSVTPSGGHGARTRELLAVVRRRGWIALLCVVLVPALVYLDSSREAKVYEATVIVQAPDTGPGLLVGGALVTNPNDPLVLDAYARTGQVVSATARVLHEPYTALGALSAGLDPKTGWIELSATGSSAAAASGTANAYFTALRGHARAEAARELNLAVAATRRTLRVTRDAADRRRLVSTLAKLGALRSVQGQPLQTIQAADGATVVSPHPRRNTILALILALLIAPGPLVLLERLDRRLRSPADLERLVGSQPLASVSERALRPGSGGRGEDELHRLRDSLGFFAVDGPLRALVIASPVDGDGRTEVTAALARSFGRTGKRIVVVDADFHRPGLAARLGVPAGPGLSDVLIGHDLDSALYRVEGFEGDLVVLPAGSPPPNPAELLGSERMSSLLGQLTERSDLVLLDVAPLLATSDALPLLRQVSGIVGVARLGRTPRGAVLRMAQVASAAGGRVIGFVLTGAKSGHESHRWGESPGSSPVPSGGIPAAGSGLERGLPAAFTGRGRRNP